MFKRLLDPKAEKRPASVLEVNKYLEDRWLAKLGAEKTMNGKDRCELKDPFSLSPVLVSLIRRLHRWRRREGRAVSVDVQLPQLSRGEESAASHPDHVRDRDHCRPNEEEGSYQRMDPSERDSRGIRGRVRVGPERGHTRLRGRGRGTEFHERQTLPRNSSSGEKRRAKTQEQDSRVVSQEETTYQATTDRKKNPVRSTSGRGTRNHREIRQFPKR